MDNSTYQIFLFIIILSIVLLGDILLIFADNNNLSYAIGVVQILLGTSAFVFFSQLINAYQTLLGQAVAFTESAKNLFPIFLFGKTIATMLFTGGVLLLISIFLKDIIENQEA